MTKRNITCPQCGKTYEIEVEAGQNYSDLECPECGSTIPLRDPVRNADDLQRVHVVKLELPRVTYRWALNVAWEFLLAGLTLAAIPFGIAIIIGVIIQAAK